MHSSRRIVRAIGFGIDDGPVGGSSFEAVLVGHGGTVCVSAVLQPMGRLIEPPLCILQSPGDGLDEDLGKKVFGLDAAVYEPVM